MNYNYKRLNEFLLDKFGEKTLKICIDGGFTCPNRDGKVSTGGCIFCSERGSGDHISTTGNITKQVKNFFASYKAKRANKFIAYFQNFTNTYDTIENLKAKYAAALIDDRIVCLAIATRPDCIDDKVIDLLKSYSEKYYVWVELGLQTSNEKTAKFINRGYSNEQFSKAVKLLNDANIDVVTHIMVGLPNENDTNLENTVDFLNSHNIQGLKIHSTYVVENTALADLYNNEKYTPISFEHYMDSLVYVITHISPDVVVHRISGDAPKDLLIAPSWCLHKKWVMNGLNNLMPKENLYQGMYYKKIAE